MRARLARLLGQGDLAVRVAVAETLAESSNGDRAPIVVLCCESRAAPAMIEQLRAACPWARIVLVSSLDAGPERGRISSLGGVEAVIGPDDARELLTPTVHTLLADETSRPRRRGPLLSHRERQVIRLAAQGCANGEIARRLSLPASSVKRHLNASVVKLTAQPGPETAMTGCDGDGAADRP